MSFVERANAVRETIPFAYWLLFDAVLGPLLVLGWWDASTAARAAWALALTMWLLAVFFDVNEAVVKATRR